MPTPAPAAPSTPRSGTLPSLRNGLCPSRPIPSPVTSWSTRQGFSGSHDLCARVIWSTTSAAQNLLAFSADPGVAFDF
jgi:hypothetical protein